MSNFKENIKSEIKLTLKALSEKNLDSSKLTHDDLDYIKDELKNILIQIDDIIND